MTMKKLFLTLVLPLLTIMSVMAMSDTRIRETARFLTDRMAYELNLTPGQYEDCFEVNYDFIASANLIMDDVVYGYSDAIDSYYDYLDYRNEDLRYILNATQFGIFMGLDYFFRPIYTTARRWAFRIYDVYHNHNYYYYGYPACYHTYHGIHSRIHHHGGFYVNRYSHPHHATPIHIHHGHDYDSHRRLDFGDRYHHRDNGHHNDRHHSDARPNNHGNGGHNNGNHGGNHDNKGHKGGNDHGNGGHNNGNHGGNNHGDTHNNAHQGGNSSHNTQPYNDVKNNSSRGKRHEAAGGNRSITHTPERSAAPSRNKGNHHDGGSRGGNGHKGGSQGGSHNGGSQGGSHNGGRGGHR